ncbi:MAG TPA: hypothetical protein VMW78_09950 [Anaerolineae bacterium]|nr:hypothetical protein [Anaerolineae bacterium]
MDKRPAPQKIFARDRDSLKGKLSILLREERMYLTSLESERELVESEEQHLNIKQYFLEVAESQQYISLLENRIKEMEKK